MGLITNVVRGEHAERLALLVHGLGADERDLPGLLPYLDGDGKYLAVAPRGPIASPPGFSWFDFAGASHPDTGLPMGLEDSLAALDTLVDETCDQEGLDRAQAIFIGFSQGAGMTLALALGSRVGTQPAGVVVMSGFLPPGVDIDDEAVRTVPVFVAHGTHDPLIPVDRGRALARALESAGGRVVYREYPMEHQVALEEVRDARTWLDEVESGADPSEPVPDDPPEGPVKVVTTATFDAEVLRAELPVIVDFWAPWCGPCRQVSPIVEQIATMRDGAYKVVKINIDEEPSLAQQYGVQSIPMIGLFRNGRLERQALGAKPRPQIEAELGMLVIP